MSTVRETIEQALGSNLPYGAERHVNAAVTALEERERGIRTGLVREGGRLGARETQVHSICDELGLTQPVAQRPVYGSTPRPNEVNGAGQPVSAGVPADSELYRRLERLERAAADRGIDLSEFDS